MKPSPIDKVREMYEDTADFYAKMMDAEIELPVYADILSRLATRLSGFEGALVDTACGSGHMLERYRGHYDPERELLGIDLSPKMVAIAAKRLGADGRVIEGDMCRLAGIADGSAAALLNFFALHHVDPELAREALREWHRVLVPRGQLVIATWEGAGAIDYGEFSDLVALRYDRDALSAWVAEAGFEITRCEVEPVEGYPMDGIYLEATKA